MSELAAYIQEIAGTRLTAATMLFDAMVLSVNSNARTCIVERIGGNSAGTLTARLMASVDDGALMVPATGSTVVVCMSEFVEPYIAMFSEIERIVWLGGDYDGVPIVTHPTNANRGLLKRLNNLENGLKSLILKFNSHVHVTSCAAGAGSAAATVAPETTVITNTAQADIEHPNITH